MNIRYTVSILLVMLTTILTGQINVNFPINAVGALVDFKGAVANVAALSGLTDAQEGQLTWVEDINEFRVYDGGAWISLPGGSGSPEIDTSANTGGGESVYYLIGTATSDEIADIISGDRVPVADNVLQTGNVQAPTGYSVPFPAWNFWPEGPNNYATEIDDLKKWKELYFPDGKFYWVNPISGDNFDTGQDEDQAFETLDFALGRPDVDGVFVTGINPGTSSFSTGRAILAIVGYGGGAIIGDIEAQKTWTYSGTRGVYRTTVADSNSWVLDMLHRDDIGSFIRMENAGSVAGLDENPGSYYYDVDTLYVHASDGAEPNTYRNVLIVDADGNSTGTSSTVYFENVESYGRWSFTQSSGDYYIRDSEMFVSPNNDLITVDDCNIIFSNVTVGHCVTDCIDYDNGATAIEHNLKGKYAGYNTTGADNQITTAHGGSKVLSLNLDLTGASNGPLFDVNAGTERAGYGGKIFGGLFNEDTGAGFTFGAGVGNNSGDSAKLYLENVDLSGGNSDYQLSANFGEIKLEGVKLNKTSTLQKLNGGTIQKN